MLRDQQRLRLWRWRYTDKWGKRRTTRYLLSEEDARERLQDPEKVEHSLFEPKPVGGTSAFLGKIKQLRKCPSHSALR